MKLVEGVHYDVRPEKPSETECCWRRHPPRKHWNGTEVAASFSRVGNARGWFHGIGHCGPCGMVTESLSHRTERLHLDLSATHAAILRNWEKSKADRGRAPGNPQAWRKLWEKGYLQRPYGNQRWMKATVTDAGRAALARYEEWKAKQAPLDTRAKA